MNSTPVSAFAAYSAANVYAQVPQKAKSSKKKTKPVIKICKDFFWILGQTH